MSVERSFATCVSSYHPVRINTYPRLITLCLHLKDIESLASACRDLQFAMKMVSSTSKCSVQYVFLIFFSDNYALFWYFYAFF